MRRRQQRVVTSTAFGPFSISCLGNLGDLIPSILIEPGSLVFIPLVACKIQISSLMLNADVFACVSASWQCRVDLQMQYTSPVSLFGNPSDTMFFWLYVDNEWGTLQMQDIFETNCSQSGVGGYWLDSFVWEIALLGNLRMSRVHTVDSSRCFTLHRIAHNQTITNNVSSFGLIYLNPYWQMMKYPQNVTSTMVSWTPVADLQMVRTRTNGKFEAYCDIVIGRWRGH